MDEWTRVPSTIMTEVYDIEVDKNIMLIGVFDKNNKT